MKCAFTTIAMLTAGAASAQPFAIESFTIDNGGGTLTSSSFVLSGTIGQPDAGETLRGATYELRGGFWTNPETPSRLCADQNMDGNVSPADFSAWVGNFNTMNPVADVNQDSNVTPADFSAWVAAFNQGANGPICIP